MYTPSTSVSFIRIWRFTLIMQCIPTEPPHFPKLQTPKHIYQAVGFIKLALLGKSYPYVNDIYVTEATQYIPLGT